MTFPIPPGTDAIARVIENFMHPGFNKLGLYLDYHGPYSDDVTLTTWSLTPGPVFTNYSVSDSFGLVVQPNGVIPAGWGRVDGWRSADDLFIDDRYVPPLGYLVAQHQLVDTGWVTTQRVTLDRFPQLVLWEDARPGRIGLRVAPNIALDLLYVHWSTPPIGP